jgi:hypothetical protein
MQNRGSIARQEPMKPLQAIILVFAVVLAGGCASRINNTMQSWVGHHQSDLIASWGPPQSTASDGKGGTILIYQSYVNLGQTPGQVTATGYGNYYYTAPQQNGYGRSRMFYVDENGIIYSWHWKGL